MHPRSNMRPYDANIEANGIAMFLDDLQQSLEYLTKTLTTEGGMWLVIRAHRIHAWLQAAISGGVELGSKKWHVMERERFVVALTGYISAS